MRKTLIVWRRTGKEHGEDAFRVNPPAVIGGRIFLECGSIWTTTNSSEAEWPYEMVFT